MHKTGGGDDFVGGIAVKIQRFDRTADIECQRLEENWLSLSSKKKKRCISFLKVAGYHDSVPGSPFHGPTISLVIQPP